VTSNAQKKNYAVISFFKIGNFIVFIAFTYT